jgi:hypothetical protein
MASVTTKRMSAFRALPSRLMSGLQNCCERKVGTIAVRVKL